MKHHILRAMVVLLVVSSVSVVGQTLPTTRETREANDVLKAQGLTRAGAMYLLEADLKLQDDLEAVGRTRMELAKNRRKRAEIQQVIQRAENSARQWAKERADLMRRMQSAGDVRKYNELVGEMNLRGDWIKEAELAVTQREQELRATSDSPDDYITQVLAVSDKIEETAKKYEALAADDSVKAALAKVNAGATTKLRLGPSGRFVQELPRRRKDRAAIQSAEIKLRLGEGVPQAEVTLNGKVKQVMVVDSGASIVTITADVASALGVVPAAGDPSIKLRAANGKEMEAKLVFLKSIQLAQFTVENVECAVLPASAKDAPCLLGGTFLRHFAYKMDLAAGTLHMSQLQEATPAAPKRTER